MLLYALFAKLFPVVAIWELEEQPHAEAEIELAEEPATARSAA
jgi:hypothetical protein